MKNLRVSRIWVAIIVIIMFIGLGLAGCKKGPASTSPGEQTTPGATSTGKAAEGYPDLGGMKVRILIPNLEGTVEEAYEDSGVTGQRVIEMVQEIQANYNCTIEYVGGVGNQAWEKLFTSILTGNPLADVSRADYWVVVQSVEKGGLYAVLNDYDYILDLDSNELWDQTLIDDFYTIDGMTFAAEAPKYGIELVYGGAVCFFNKSMLEREGLWNKYNLYEMQRNKTWTWDVMDEIGYTVTKDRDGDGTLDQFGLIYKYTITHMGFNASNTNKVSGWGWYEVDADGVPRFRGRDQDKLNLLHYFRDSGPKGRGWMRSFEWADGEHEPGPVKYFAGGNCAFLVDHGNQIATIHELEMQDTLGVVAMPLGPDNLNGDYNIARVYYNPWVIPRNAPDGEASAYILKEISRPLYTEEEEEIGIEAVLASVIGDEVEIIETYKMLGRPERAVYNKETPFIATWAGVIASYHGSFMSAIIENGFMPEELNELYADQIQTFINDYWNKVLEGAERLKKKRKEQGLD
ncbi:MAG TPA: ABC transporter substrate-binding protein [Clostridia bacterium]|nr:ABC transporter substrate-binding protein [Clostridia bacterium]